VELLEVFSPVSSAPARRRLGAPGPASRTLLTRSGSQSARQDLEESQILEDIFFIC